MLYSSQVEKVYSASLLPHPPATRSLCPQVSPAVSRSFWRLSVSGHTLRRLRVHPPVPCALFRKGSMRRTLLCALLAFLLLQSPPRCGGATKGHLGCFSLPLLQTERSGQRGQVGRPTCAPVSRRRAPVGGTMGFSFSQMMSDCFPLVLRLVSHKQCRKCWFLPSYQFFDNCQSDRWKNGLSAQFSFAFLTL